MAIELSRGLEAEVLVTCAVEWHPRYGGAGEAAPARRAVQAAVRRLRAAGVEASGQVVVTLAGEGPRVVADEVAAFGAGLLIVAERRTPRLLRALGLGLARRLARTCRVPVLLLPEVHPRRQRSPSPPARSSPPLRVVR
jgi:nucleotide-binding universal stress UspA family protein